ncbi:MAG: HAD-IC family P-type ATPase, partial [Caldilineaceae bacterium]|nr:HAD-IC family P-type ATPase [Caldilineaceae bacterium]
MLWISAVAGCCVAGITGAKVVDNLAVSQTKRGKLTIKRAFIKQKNLVQILSPQKRQPIMASKLKALDEKYQTFMVEHIDPLFGSTRHQQFKEMVSSAHALKIDSHEREINHGILFSLITFGAASVAKLVFPPLLLVSLGSGLYGSSDVIQKAYHHLFHERRVTNAVLVSLNLIGIWLGGYYVVGAFALTIYYLGLKLIYITQDRSSKSLVNIFEQPDSVYILVDGVEVEAPFAQLQVGDQLMIYAGQTVPVDGTILEGIATIDQHALTGEAQPAEKEEGDPVFASTVVLAGKIRIQVEKAGAESVAAQIGHILNNTVGYQLAIESKGLQLVNRMALPTLLLAGMAWPLVGYEAMVAILGASIGMNIRITGPIAMLNFLNIASNHAILVKDGRSLELLHTVDTVVFDKTGTLTVEQPHVTHIHVCDQIDANEVLAYAAAAEYHQTHPIAKAILQAANERGLPLPKIDQARYEMGYGIKVQVVEHTVRVGSDRYMRLEEIIIPEEIVTLQEVCQAQGHSLVMVAINERLVGAIELQPTIRPEAKQVIAELRQKNLELVIISGDQEEPTRRLAQELGIDRYFANTLPENKAALVDQLQREGRSVCFVGDGIND